MDKFDLIIANPPFRIGNKVISTFMDKASESIVLAPAKCYRDRNVYKYIDELQLADPKLFKDAAITGNLSIVRLINKENNQSYHDIYLDNICVPEFKDYYKKNIKTKAKWKELANLLTEKDLDNYDVATSFIIPSRASNNGVCKNKNTADFYYNVLNEKKYIGSYVLQLSEKAKKNLAQFYYYNPLMNSLLRGLNTTGGSNLCYLAAIPHLNWSIDRDYEHCTLDDIMTWLDDDDQSWEEIELLTYDPKYKAFYELNSRCSNYAIDAYERVPQRDGIRWDYDVNKAFAIMARTAQNGVHKVDGKGAFDLDVNIYKTKTIADTLIWKHSDGRDAQAAASYIYFNSTTEKDNLVKFWYYNPLMNSLLKGLNKAGGNFKIAIPHIDWSKDRDYEHCTLDDIMKWLEEDNK